MVKPRDLCHEAKKMHKHWGCSIGRSIGIQCFPIGSKDIGLRSPPEYFSIEIQPILEAVGVSELWSSPLINILICFTHIIMDKFMSTNSCEDFSIRLDYEAKECMQNLAAHLLKFYTKEHYKSCTQKVQIHG